MWAAKQPEWKEAEKLQLKLGKALLGLPKSGPSVVVYGLLGWLPLRLLRLASVLTLWGKVVSGPPTSPCLQLYEVLREQVETEELCNWASDVKLALKSLRFPAKRWWSGVSDAEEWREEVMERVKSQWAREWSALLQTSLAKSPRLRCFSHFCVSPSPSRCLEWVTADRHLWVRAIAGASVLSCDTMRGAVSRELRVCPFCPQSPEDLEHVFFVCPTYAALRERLVGSVDSAIVSRLSLVFGGEPALNRVSLRFLKQALLQRASALAARQSGSLSPDSPSVSLRSS